MKSLLLAAIAMILVCTVDYRVAVAEDGERKAAVTGIGGVFLLSRDDAKALSAWYEQHLGLRMEDFGAAILQWKDDTAEDGGVTVWHAKDPATHPFSPSKSPFMINYRVNDLETMIKQLTDAGIDILAGPEYHENGAFAWIMDPEGNKIELWEPKIWDEKNKQSLARAKEPAD